MDPIYYINRRTGKLEQEKIYGEAALDFLYGRSWLARYIGRFLCSMFSRISLFSAFYGWYQKQSWTKCKIAPFIEKFEVDSSEFLEKADHFASFNDFFIRKLKREARPLAPGSHVAIIPADGRYLFYPQIHLADGFVVKGKKFSLSTLLADDQLARQYAKGTLILGRLCPSDYHRFHFPCDCVPCEHRLINGALFSVNPFAVKQHVEIFTENKRSITELHTKRFGKVLYIEIGATNVGSIHQTYTPYLPYLKGDEKGYFSFGGSSLILLFQPGAVKLDPDLLDKETHREVRCLVGQSMGLSSD